MPLLSDEGKACDLTDIATQIQSFITAAGNGDTEAAKKALAGVGTLTLSLGDKKIGFFRRFAVSCSTDLSMPCPSPSSQDSSTLKMGLKSPPKFPDSCQEWAKFMPDGTFYHGEIKLDWVRIGLLIGVAMLLILLLYSLTRGRDRNY